MLTLTGVAGGSEAGSSSEYEVLLGMHTYWRKADISKAASSDRKKGNMKKGGTVNVSITNPSFSASIESVCSLLYSPSDCKSRPSSVSITMATQTLLL